jgi:photosystem II stability/assembly factor-like uncharacterized protein
MLVGRGALACSLLVLSWFASACHEVHFEPRTGSGEIVMYDDLFSVSPVGEERVVVSGYWGSIYVSENGGQSWIQAETGTKRLIYDVAMANAKQGWAVGQVGLVLRTEDGGLTWSLQSTPKDDQAVNLFAVAAIDENRAWAVGDWGTQIYTADGGQTWQDKSLVIDETHPQFVWLSIPDQERVREGKPVYEDVGLNDIYCLPRNSEYCWIIGEFAYLFRTENGGETWEKGEILSGMQVDPIQFGYNEVAISESDFAAVREFAAQIADQQHLNVAIEPRASAREIRNLGKADDPFPLFDMLEARTQEIVAAVEDAGINTDRLRRRGAPPWDYEDFLEDDPEFLNRYLEGRKADGPRVEVAIAQNPYLFTVRFADESEGYISGLGGVVLRTTDGGRIWRYEGIGRKQAIFSVFPFDANNSMIVGEKGLARISSDGGVTWSAASDFPTIFTYLRDIQFESENRKVGYIVGQKGMVLRSTDAGATWTKVLPKPREISAEVAAH